MNLMLHGIWVKDLSKPNGESTSCDASSKYKRINTNEGTKYSFDWYYCGDEDQPCIGMTEQDILSNQENCQHDNTTGYYDPLCEFW